MSLFIDADPEQIEAAHEIGAPVIEIHTGHYADAVTPAERADALERIRRGVEQGLALGLQVNAGHGLDYHNVKAIAAIPGVRELNIGHCDRRSGHLLGSGSGRARHEERHGCGGAQDLILVAHPRRAGLVPLPGAPCPTRP